MACVTWKKMSNKGFSIEVIFFDYFCFLPGEQANRFVRFWPGKLEWN